MLLYELDKEEKTCKINKFLYRIHIPIKRVTHSNVPFYRGKKLYNIMKNKILETRKPFKILKQTLDMDNFLILNYFYRDIQAYKLSKYYKIGSRDPHDLKAIFNVFPMLQAGIIILFETKEDEILAKIVLKDFIDKKCLRS